MDDAEGPDLRRSAGGVGLNGEDVDWNEFLLDHDHHGPLVLEQEPAGSDLGALLHTLVTGAAAEPLPPPPVLRRGGLVSVATLWGASGRPDEEGAQYTTLDAMVSDLLACSGGRRRPHTSPRREEPF